MANSSHSTDGLLAALLSKLQVDNAPKQPSHALDPELFCKALTQDPYTKKHTGHRCTFRKLVDDTKPYEMKTIEELVADELCGGHKKMKEKFMHIIIPQLKLQRDYPPTFTTFASTQPQLQAAIQTARRQTSPYQSSGEGDPFVPAPAADKGHISQDQILRFQRVMKNISVHAQEITRSQSSEPSNPVATAAANIQQLADAMEKLLQLSDPTGGTDTVVQGKRNPSVVCQNSGTSQSSVRGQGAVKLETVQSGGKKLGRVPANDSHSGDSLGRGTPNERSQGESTQHTAFRNGGRSAFTQTASTQNGAFQAGRLWSGGFSGKGKQPERPKNTNIQSCSLESDGIEISRVVIKDEESDLDFERMEGVDDSDWENTW